MPLDLNSVPPAEQRKIKLSAAPVVDEEQQRLLATLPSEDKNYLRSVFESALQRYAAELPTLPQGGRAPWCAGHKHESSRNCALNCAAIDVSGFVKSGVGTDDEVEDALRGPAEASGLEESEVTATLDSARGAAEPKDWRRILDGRMASAAPVDLGQETEEHPAVTNPFPSDIFPPAIEVELNALADAHGDTGGCLTKPSALSAASAAYMGQAECAVSQRHAPCPVAQMTVAVKQSTAGSGVILGELTRVHMQQDRQNVQAHQRAIAEHQERVEEKKHLTRQQRRHPDVNIGAQIGARPKQPTAAVDVQRPPLSREFVRQNITPENCVEVTGETFGEMSYVVDDEGTFHQVAMGSYGGDLNVNDICRMWSGLPLKFSRSRRRAQGAAQSVALYRPLLAATTAMQYNKAAKIASNSDANEQGYVARQLWSACTLRDRTWEEVEGQRRPTLVAWELAIAPAIRKGYVETRRNVTADADALKLLGKLHNRVRDQKQPGGIYAAHRPFAGRIVEHTCRIAVVLQLLWQPESSVVTAETMERAIRVIAFFEAHYLYLFGAAVETPKSVTVARFLGECCTRNADAKIESKALFAAYAAWCGVKGFEPVVSPQFGRLLSDLGMKRRESNGKSIYPLELI